MEGEHTGDDRWSLELAVNFPAGFFPQLGACWFEIPAEGPPAPPHTVSLHQTITKSLFAPHILLNKMTMTLRKKKSSFPVKAESRRWSLCGAIKISECDCLAASSQQPCLGRGGVIAVCSPQLANLTEPSLPRGLR